MRIHSVTLCNFRSFKGEHKIDMTPDSDRDHNIILIGGANGSGKTTIVDSMKLCMFGRAFNGFPMSREQYHDYLLTAKNRSAREDNDSRFFVQVEIEVNDDYPSYVITLKKEWDCTQDEVRNETFTIYRDGAPLEIVPRDYWEDYVISLIPPYVSEFFFLDGERVGELATGQRADQVLRKSIQDLTGLKLYTTLARDIHSLMSKVRRRNIADTELQDRIAAVGKQTSTIDKEMDALQRGIDTRKSELTKLCDLKRRIQNDLRRKAGAYAQERNRNEKALLGLREEVSCLNERVRQICGEIAPFLIAPGIRADLLVQLKREKLLRELAATRYILTEVNQKLMENLKGAENLAVLPRDQFNTIKAEINKVFRSMSNDISSDSQESLIHDLTNADMDSIQVFVERIARYDAAEFIETLKLKQRSLLQIKKLNALLRQVPDERFVQSYVERLASLDVGMQRMEQEIGELKAQEQSLREERAELQETITELEERTVCIEEDARKIDVCSRVKDSIQEFADVVVSLKTRELEQTATDMFRRLAHKNDMIKTIRIAPRTFVTSLVDFGDSIVSKNSISAGEKEIYALSILWGLSRISNKNLPLIVDSPFSKMDKNHAGRIAQHFFPNAAGQVVLLCHDREIDAGLYADLEPYVNRAYVLSVDEANKIREGYFFK